MIIDAVLRHNIIALKTNQRGAIMKEINKKQRKIQITMFSIYLILLVWIILFKLITDFSMLSILNLQAINLVPFKDFHEAEVIANILFFFPFGYFLSVLFPNKSFLIKVIPIALASLSFEILQYIFAIGITDITDLITNTFGGIIGIVCYHIINAIVKKSEKKDKVFIITTYLGMAFFVGCIFIELFI